MLEPELFKKAARDLSYALIKEIENNTGSRLGEEERQKFELWVEPLLEQFEFEVIARAEDELNAWECDGYCEMSEDLRSTISDLEDDKYSLEQKVDVLQDKLDSLQEYHAD